MRRYSLCCIGVLSLVLNSSYPAQAESLMPVPFTDVQVDDAFWSPRIKVNRERVLPHDFKYCETTGRINNFLKAAGKMEGPFEGIFFNDSDVYKVIEGAAYSLAQEKDPALEKTADEVIDKIAAAQLPDGYLYTFYTVNKQLEKRWTAEKDMHETYCAGHLIEAAVAYYQATGKRKLLDVAIRLADHIDSVFGPDRKHEVPGHEEIELALVKLWWATGEERYLSLARFFIEERGHARGRQLQGEYSQDLVPVREQREITGHAVRAMYLYCGVTDLAGMSGDAGLTATVDSIWKDVTERKMYLTGGIGPSAANEGFTVPYDLPNDSAYAETCAAIGMSLWNQRMALMHADSRYADVVERELYNGALAGVSLDGERFFYVNPLASRGHHHRELWFGCACCPVNVVRFLPTVGGYAYARGRGSIYVNQYLGSRAQIKLGGKTVILTQKTRYPWDGQVTFLVESKEPSSFALHLRVPGWCQGPSLANDLYQVAGRPESGAVKLSVNGDSVRDFPIADGYAVVSREWKAGDRIVWEMPMPPRRVRANAKVGADVGRVALQRGPVVYCLEGVDNDDLPRSLSLPAKAELKSDYRDQLLGGVMTIQGKALARMAGKTAPKPFRFTAIPYYAWDNRKPGPMVVWLPEDSAQAESAPLPTIANQSAVSASHKNGSDTYEALNDSIEPASSHDQGVPRFTWWDHRGSHEWVQYDFKTKQRVAAAEVYWFDDTGVGQCRAPKSWQVLYREGDTWKPVTTADAFGLKLDQFNRVRFTPVETSAVRLLVELQPNSSGGILEWRVLP